MTSIPAAHPTTPARGSRTRRRSERHLRAARTPGGEVIPVSAPNDARGQAAHPATAPSPAAHHTAHHTALSGSRHTSTQAAPAIAAMRSGAMRSALVTEPAAGTTSSKVLNDTSQ